MIGPHFENRFLVIPLLHKVPAVRVLESNAKDSRAALSNRTSCDDGNVLCGTLIWEPLATWDLKCG